MGTELPYTKILPVNAKFDSIYKSFEEDMKRRYWVFESC